MRPVPGLVACAVLGRSGCSPYSGMAMGSRAALWGDAEPIRGRGSAGRLGMIGVGNSVGRMDSVLSSGLLGSGRLGERGRLCAAAFEAALTSSEHNGQAGCFASIGSTQAQWNA